MRRGYPSFADLPNTISDIPGWWLTWHSCSNRIFRDQTAQWEWELPVYAQSIGQAQADLVRTQAGMLEGLESTLGEGVEKTHAMADQAARVMEDAVRMTPCDHAPAEHLTQNANGLGVVWCPECGAHGDQHGSSPDGLVVWTAPAYAWHGGLLGALNDVAAFHRGCGNTDRSPTDPAALIKRVTRHKLLREEYIETEDAMVAHDIVGVIEGLLDVIYIAVGSGLQFCGPKRFALAWAEVHRSSMDKIVDGKVFKRGDGKILKPEGWVPPDIAGALRSDGH